MAANPFNLIKEVPSHSPHRFRAYRYNRKHDNCWRAVVDGFLAARRLTAPALYKSLTEAGFQQVGLDKYLNAQGQAQLPQTPSEDSNVTRDPAITDMTEVIALEVLKWSEPGLELPYPRVLHKESFPLQHHGIDSLGFSEKNGEYTLYVIEIMASVDSNHPPATVRDHLNQILPETLNEPTLKRLLQDLQTVHDESREDKEKNILNGFITATLDKSLSANQAVVASPILVRRFEEFDEKDWKPFVDRKKDFEKAKIPSTVFFIAVECHDSFSGLLNLIKQKASMEDTSDSTTGGGEE